MASSTTITKLADSGIKHAIDKTAPSLKTTNGTVPSPLAELDASKLIFNPKLNTTKAVPEPHSPEVWSKSFCTDNMITATWRASTGWSAPHLTAYAPLTLHPTASVFHYATSCFEGLKFYRGHDGRLRLFRPALNSKRMLASATRISLPPFHPDEMQKLFETLVAVEGPKWLPKERPGEFLYLRPMMVGTTEAIGVAAPTEARLFVIAVFMPAYDFPVGSEAAGPELGGTGVGKPGLKLLASEEDAVRAWPGGFGNAKVGANYGPGMLPEAEAKRRGYHFILWLFGEGEQVTEAGPANFFVVWRTGKEGAGGEGRLEMVTAPLGNGMILDGVTRRSVLELARERLGEEVAVVERDFGMQEVRIAVEEGRLVEAFVAGTAYFITPVSVIRHKGSDLDIPLENGTTGKYAAMIKTWLGNIMWGKEKHSWGVVVEEAAVKA